MIIGAFLLFTSPNVKGEIWEVPEHLDRIQTAIDSASNGDTVSVRPGDTLYPAVYYENINFKGKNIIVSARKNIYRRGGGIYISGSKPTIRKVLVSNNSLSSIDT